MGEQDAERIKKYVADLTPNELYESSLGDQKRKQIENMKNMDIIPAIVRILDKYDNCQRFMLDPAGKTKEEIKK